MLCKVFSRELWHAEAEVVSPGHRPSSPQSWRKAGRKPPCGSLFRGNVGYEQVQSTINCGAWRAPRRQAVGGSQQSKHSVTKCIVSSCNHRREVRSVEEGPSDHNAYMEMRALFLADAWRMRWSAIPIPYFRPYAFGSSLICCWAMA